MAYKFNIFTGNFDYYEAGAAPAGSIDWGEEVTYYSDLPDPTTVSGKVYLVTTETAGDWWVGFLNKKPAGLYQSNGTTWTRLPNNLYLYSLGDTNITAANLADLKMLGYNATSHVWEPKTFAELGAAILGTLSNLLTTAKDNIVNAINEIFGSISDLADTGFIAWTSGTDASTYTFSGGVFTILRAGKGRINGTLISWSAGISVSGLANNTTYFIYVDTDGTLKASASYVASKIMLFECLYDGAASLVVKENHPYASDTQNSGFLHVAVGTIIAGTGAIATRVSTGTGAAAGDKQIKIVGADSLLDHGLTTVIPDSGGAAVNWLVYYKNAAGKWIQYASQTRLPVYYNNAGTPTILGTAGPTQYTVFTLYVTKDDIHSSAPQYIALMNTSASILSGTATAITSGAVQFADNELKTMELAQLGYAVVGNNATSDGVQTGFISSITVAKSTLNQQLVGGSVANTSSLVTNDTTGYNDTSLTNMQLVANKVDQQAALVKREVLTAERTYYVRSDGGDSNTGLANTAGGAFLTIQKAIDTASMLDSSIYDVTIKIGTTGSTFTGVLVGKNMVGSGSVIIEGYDANAANTTLSASSGLLFSSTDLSTRFHLKNMTLSGAAVVYLLASNSTIWHENVTFGVGCTAYHQYPLNNGIIEARANYYITGGTVSHIFVGANGICLCQGKTVALTNGLAFTTFCEAVRAGIAIITTVTFTGTGITGKRYNVIQNSVIDVGGAGASALPGNTSGTAASGGQYV